MALCNYPWSYSSLVKELVPSKSSFHYYRCKCTLRIREWQLHKWMLQLFHCPQQSQETGHSECWGQSTNKFGVRMGLEQGLSLDLYLPRWDPQHFPGPGHCRHRAKKIQRFSLEEAFWESFSREGIKNHSKSFCWRQPWERWRFQYGFHLPF